MRRLVLLSIAVVALAVGGLAGTSRVDSYHDARGPVADTSTMSDRPLSVDSTDSYYDL